MKAGFAMRLRSLRLVIAAMITVFAALLAMSGTAFAGVGDISGPPHFPGIGSATVPVTHFRDGSLLLTLGDEFNVGDCAQFAGSTVRLSAPDANGFVLVVWTAAGQTRKTNNADIWHQSVVLLASNGTRTVSVATMDGDPMKETFTRVPWKRAAVVKANRAALAASTTSAWTGRC